MLTLVSLDTLLSWEEMQSIRQILKHATQSPSFDHFTRAAAIKLIQEIDSAMGDAEL